MQKASHIITFSLFFLYFSYIQASIIYVKHNATGDNNGTSWTHAYTQLQAAIDAAAYSGDEIWVAAGTYYPTKDKSGVVPADSRKKTFRIYKSIGIYGGFAGSENLLSQRNPATNVTALNGSTGLTSVYQVVYIASLNGATLDGFTISNGKADGSSSYANGGGIYLSNASNVLLQNLLIQDCEAIKGGGIYNENSNSVTVENVRFRRNDAEKGGGMYNDNTSAIVVRSCGFCNNTSEEGGGGMYNKSLSSLMIVNSVFSGNTSEGNGGGVYNHSLSAITVTNSTFYQNESDGNGGGFYIVSSSSCSFYNSIFWDNTDQNGSAAANSQAYANGSTSSKNSYYTLIKGSNGSGGGWASAFTDGGNNLDNDPLFYDANGSDNTSCTDDDNFGLSAGSPALNAGTNSAPGITASDADGEARVQDGTVDLGPFEGLGDAGFPVEWAFIEAQWETGVAGRVAEIQWGTTQEINNDYFVIERAVKGSIGDTWSEVGRTEGAGTTDKATVYTFEDHNIPANADGIVLSYRIRQVDIDGRFSFSKTVELVLWGNDRASFAVYPNPTSSSLTLQAAIEGDQMLETVRILSLTGQAVYETNPSAARWEETIDVSHLPKGLYFAQMVYTYGQKSIRLMVR
ncbi:MAG: T9SS type A sorting domain-containing protein [Bacteroidia bacterium]